MLPMRKELLQGALGADLLAYTSECAHHNRRNSSAARRLGAISTIASSPWYTRHFRSSAQKILGQAGVRELEEGNTLSWTERAPPPIDAIEAAAAEAAAAAAGQAAAAEIELPREASLGTFPIGITPERFQETMESKAVQREIDSLQKKFGDRKVLLGIDRLDPIKGIPHKLLAFARLLETHPEYIGKVVLVQITVPSRLDVPLHQQLVSACTPSSARSTAATARSTTCRSTSTAPGFESWRALRRAGSCCHVRDGMNLVSFEWVVCQQYKRGFPLGGDPGATDTARVDENNPGSNAGVLVLSEFAVRHAQFGRN